MAQKAKVVERLEPPLPADHFVKVGLLEDSQITRSAGPKEPAIAVAVPLEPAIESNAPPPWKLVTLTPESFTPAGRGELLEAHRGTPAIAATGPEVSDLLVDLEAPPRSAE